MRPKDWSSIDNRIEVEKFHEHSFVNLAVAFVDLS